MDGILALTHFCESHGPCVILCTQRCKEEPQQFPHNLSVPWCESCQSIDLDQSLVSRNNNVCYVTTRTPLQQDLAFLLKQAAVRSLSCEETSVEGGTLYFGDSERGHVISHTFTLRDSLARGFHRKYSILMLMRDKIHLLNNWPFLTTHIKSIASDLQAKASNINEVEQARISQRAVRQAQGSPSNPARSLSQLIGEPAIFAQIHMWFTWLLSSETIIEKPPIIPEILVSCPNPQNLRKLKQQMNKNEFQTVCYCILTGICVETKTSILDALKQLLPTFFSLPKKGEVCKLNEQDTTWEVNWSGCLPPKLPQLLSIVEEALENENLNNNALEAHLISIVFKWCNIAKTLSWIAVPNSQVLQSLGVQKHDLPLLAYWTAQCRHFSK